jgi:hypothetical protein
MRKGLLATAILVLWGSLAWATNVHTSAGGMVQWTQGQLVLSQTNVWYDVPTLNQTIRVQSNSLWRVHANVRYRFIPIRNGNYASARLRLLVDDREVNLVGVVFHLSAGQSTEEVNQHQSIEAVVELPPGNHTLNVQVLKWQDAADSHIDVFADLNGYSTLLWHKVADL